MTVSGGTIPKTTTAAAHVLEGREIELKLLADSETLGRLLDSPLIGRSTVSKTTSKLLEATYYDTSERELARRDAALRVRRSGKQYVQTLKLSAGNGAVHRLEYEGGVPGMAPQLDILPLAELGAPFDTLKAEQLAPVFTTKVRRQTRNIAFSGAAVEIAFDEGELIAGGRTAPVCELELELKSGEVGALYELALSLLDHGAFQLGPQTKAERGYALAFGTRPSAEKAFSSGIEAGDSTDQVIAKTLMACQRHVMANLAAATDGQEPDGVHQLRVALRRLRTAIWLFGKEFPASALQSLAPDARRLASALGPARNWDVFLTTTVAEIEAQELPGIDFTELKDAAGPFRARSYEVAGRDLTGVDGTHFLLSLGRVIERRSWRNDIGIDSLAVLTQPARNLASRALTRLARKAAKQGQQMRKLEPEARHELRLTLKKLRYSAEFFLPLYDQQGESAQKYLKSLARLQNILGADNDATTTRGLLQEIETTSASPKVHRALGAIAGWQGCDRIERSRELRQSWQQFQEMKPFWD